MLDVRERDVVVAFLVVLLAPIGFLSRGLLAFEVRHYINNQWKERFPFNGMGRRTMNLSLNK
jgi:hypothetical protein